MWDVRNQGLHIKSYTLVAEGCRATVSMWEESREEEKKRKPDKVLRLRQIKHTDSHWKAQTEPGADKAGVKGHWMKCD